jgi:hypothetical protein
MTIKEQVDPWEDPADIRCPGCGAAVESLGGGKLRCLGCGMTAETVDEEVSLYDMRPDIDYTLAKHDDALTLKSGSIFGDWEDNKDKPS